RSIQRHGPPVVVPIFHDLYAGGPGKDFIGFGNVRLGFKLDVQGLGMRPQNRNANASGCDAKRVVVEDLRGLLHHLDLLFAITVRGHRRIVRKEIEGVGMGMTVGLKSRFWSLAKVSSSS